MNSLNLGSSIEGFWVFASKSGTKKWNTRHSLLCRVFDSTQEAEARAKRKQVFHVRSLYGGSFKDSYGKQIRLFRTRDRFPFWWFDLSRKTYILKAAEHSADDSASSEICTCLGKGMVRSGSFHIYRKNSTICRIVALHGAIFLPWYHWRNLDHFPW